VQREQTYLIYFGLFCVLFIIKRKFLMMNPNLKSLLLCTDLIFHRFAGEVEVKPDYTVIRTPSQPDYFWGNYLILPGPPSLGDYALWLAAFEREIGAREQRGFMALTWDGRDGEAGAVEPFLEAGFALQRSTGLVIASPEQLQQPPHLNPNLQWQILSSASDWLASDQVHFDPDWPYGHADAQRAFIATQRQSAQAMVDAGLGLRFCAKIADQVVADLGIYWDGSLGRFNNVSTHPHFWGQGICQSLVYYAAQYVFAECGLRTLVIEAESDSQAGRIYQRLGFVATEQKLALEWVRPQV
jgi:RimJ/RimL family protein N-acetyltransferase